MFRQPPKELFIKSRISAVIIGRSPRLNMIGAIKSDRLLGFHPDGWHDVILSVLVRYYFESSGRGVVGA